MSRKFRKVLRDRIKYIYDTIRLNGPWAADILQPRRRLLSVQTGLSSFGGEEIFRTKMPDVPFGTVADISANSPDKNLVTPAYDAYLARLDNAVVHTGTSFVFGPNDEAIYDVIADVDYGYWVFIRYEPAMTARWDDIGLFQVDTPSQHIEQAFHLCGYLSEHFGHWICEYLPRLRHLERLPDWENVPILVNDDMPESHYEALGLLTKNPLIHVSRGSTHLVERLYVAPTINYIPPDYYPNHPVPIERQAVWSGEAMQFMRDRILPNTPPSQKPTTKIFLSRKNSTWARMTNETEVENTFAELGFEIVQPETLSFTEQVQCMQSADFIAGPSGSAFNLAMFARPGTPILMLAQGEPHNWGGWLGPMRQIGFDVKFLLSKSSSTKRKLAPYDVDLSRIPDIIAQMSNT
ncbi:MAG: glycosyltransferase family 61 protein [Paracoccaceae bacterium]